MSDERRWMSLDFRAIEASIAQSIASGEIVGTADKVSGVRYFSTPQSKDADYFASLYNANPRKLREQYEQEFPVNTKPSESQRIGVDIHERYDRYLKENPVRTLQDQMIDAAEQLLATKAEQSMVTFDGLNGSQQRVSMNRTEARALLNEHDRRPFTQGEVMAMKLAAAGFGSHYLRQQLGWIQQQRDLKARSGVQS